MDNRTADPGETVDRTGLDSPVRGVCPVVEVPFHEDESLDLDGFGTVIDRLLGSGVNAMMFPGFASEVHKLADAERVELREMLLRRTRTRPDITGVVSLPDHATVHAVRAATEAARGGADVLNVLPPHQLAPARSAILDHLAAVLRAVAPLPVIVQYAPAQTGTALDPATLRRLAARHPNLAAVKVESTPPGAFISALAASGDDDGRPLPALVGYGGLQMIDAMRRGAAGVQPGCSFPELYLAIWRDWHAGRRQEAIRLHTRMLPYLSYWMQSVELIVAAEKDISRRRGWIATDRCRAPGHDLDAEEHAMIDRFLTEFTELLPPATT